jgi:molecular chaperone Hsp33
MALNKVKDSEQRTAGGRLVRALAANQTLRLIAADTTGLAEALRIAHDASPLGTKALSRVATAAVLLSATLKDRQQLGVQVNGDGCLGETYAIADCKGDIRATVLHPRATLGGGAEKLGDGFGAGRLSITRQLTDEAPYRGVVNLVTGEIAEDLAHYLLTSDQLPSAVSIGEVFTNEGVASAGGLLVQAMPGTKDEDLGQLIEKIESLAPMAELLRAGESLESVLTALMPDAQFMDERDLNFHCPCTRELFARRLCTIGEAELIKLTKALEETVVECHFCRAEYRFDAEQISALVYGARMYDEAD